MKLSQRRRSALYRAINEAVIKARIELQGYPEMTSRMDARVAAIEMEAFISVIAVLEGKAVR